jgi:DNA-binding NtrC family response regulator
MPGVPIAQVSQQVAVTGHSTISARSTVLVVDDEPGLRGLARRMLEEAGYDVLEAADGQAALQLVNETHASVKMVLTDIRMPIMNGWQLAESLTSRQPPVPVVLMSGGSGAEAAFHPAVNFLAKPFSDEALVGLVRRVLAAAV